MYIEMYLAYKFEIMRRKIFHLLGSAMNVTIAVPSTSEYKLFLRIPVKYQDFIHKAKQSVQ